MSTVTASLGHTVVLLKTGTAQLGNSACLDASVALAYASGL